MIHIASLVLLVFNFVLTEAAGGGYGVNWNYKINGVVGPDRWKVNYTACGGTSNSPINILTKHVKINKDLELEMNNYDQIGGNVTFGMKNRNTDIEFKGKPENKLPQTVTFKGTTYRFWQLHFHWGAENFKGSEHLVDWQRFAAELHMIHFNTKYDGLVPAHTESDGLLVWGHFLKVNSRDGVDNPQFQKILDQFGNAKTDNVTDVNINLLKLLPKDHDKFFTYKGGLTTPPCHETVRWVVNRDPILVSENQMKVFRSLKDKKMGGGVLADNFRPPQELNNRIVEANFDPTVTGSSGLVITPCYLTFFSIVAALLFSI